MDDIPRFNNYVTIAAASTVGPPGEYRPSGLLAAVARVASTMKSRSPLTAELCVSHNRPPPTGARQLAGPLPQRTKRETSGLMPTR